MREAHAALARRGIPLASNQVEYSLVHRQPETNGVLDACRELGVTLIAYSPLGMGALTGKYSATQKASGLRRILPNFNKKAMNAVQPVVELLRQIGEGKAVGGQINWFRAKQEAGATTTTAQAEVSWAHRPANSQWSFLNKTEYRYDSVKNAVAGLPGPIGGAPFLVDGNVKSTRVINSLSVNYTPVSYTHLRAHETDSLSRMPSSA